MAVAYDSLRFVDSDPSDLLDKVGEAVVCLDEQWRFTYANAKACRVYGKPREQLIGASIWRLFPEFAGTPFQDRCSQAMAQRIPADCELHDSSMDRWYDMRIRPRHGGLCIICREATERKWVEQELQDRDLALRNLMSILPLGVMLADPFGQCRYFNEHGCRMFGMTLQEALGDGWLRAVHHEDRVRAAMLRLASSAPSCQTGTELRLELSGNVRWVKVSVLREFDEEGSVRGYVLAILDITDRKPAALVPQTHSHYF